MNKLFGQNVTVIHQRQNYGTAYAKGYQEGYIKGFAEGFRLALKKV